MNERAFKIAYKKNVILYQPQIVEELLHSTRVEGDLIVHTLSTDISLLFNQERLNRLGPDSLRVFIENMNNYPNISELAKNISEEDMFKFIKSRNYQSLGELKSWSHYLMSNFESELNEYQKAKEEKERQDNERRERERTDTIKKFLDEHPEYRSVK